MQVAASRFRHRSGTTPLCLLVLPLFTLTSAPLEAQVDGTPIIVGENIQITSQNDKVPHVEPHLAINPIDADNFVVAAMAFPKAGNGPRIRVYTSFDGGTSWNRQSLEEVRGDDPWLAFDSTSTTYLVHLPGEVRRSGDGGRTWLPLTPLPLGTAGPYDYPKIAVDGTGGPFAGRVYVWANQADRLPSGTKVWPAALLRSADSARTFSWPEHVLPNNFNNQNGDFVILADGTLVASFHEIELRGEFLQSPRLWAVRSSDGGATFSVPFLVTESFLADSPRLAVDRSGGMFDGRIYLAWTGLTPDREQWNSFLASSDDGGESWSEPVSLGAPRPRAGHVPHSPMIAVNRQGVVGLSWQDPQQDSQEPCFALHFTASLDGGRTFLPGTQVASEASCSNTPANQILIEEGGSTVARRWEDGGDYHGLVARPDGSFQAVWADSRTGVFQLWTAPIEVRTSDSAGRTPESHWPADADHS